MKIFCWRVQKAYEEADGAVCEKQEKGGHQTKERKVREMKRGRNSSRTTGKKRCEIG